MVRMCLFKDQKSVPSTEMSPAHRPGGEVRQVTQTTTWCGRTQYSQYALTTSPTNRHLCPKCSKNYAVAQLKTQDNPRFLLGARLDLTSDDLRYAYKSIYPILDTSRQEDDQSIGFVTIENGWGKSWSVKPWHCQEAISDAQHLEPRMSPDAVQYKPEPDRRVEVSQQFKSKEAALLAIPVMVEQGKLPSRQEVLARARAGIERMKTRRWQIEKEAEEAKQRQEEARVERQKRLDMVATRFRAMLASNLTAPDQNAVKIAAELLGIDVGATA